MLGQETDLSAAAVKKALATQRYAVTAHPNDPTTHVALAYTLTDAGMNDLAAVEVRKATAVAPKSAFAYSAQGWVLRHNVVGVDFGVGFDYDGSLAAYQHAIQLDPNDLDIRENLANLYEHDRNGVEYSSGANLAGAIEIYRYVKSHQRIPKADVIENLAIALFYSGMYQDALAQATKQYQTPKMDGVLVAANVALKGAQAGIDAVNELDGSEGRRKEALQFAAEGLWNMRLYAQAADVLTASLPYGSSREVVGQIQLFRQLQQYQRENLEASDPRLPVERLLRAAILQTLTPAVMADCISQHRLQEGGNGDAGMRDMNALAGRFLSVSRRTGLPRAVVEDLLLGNMKIRVVPGEGPGSRVVVDFLGQQAVSFFVLKEDGSYRIAAAATDRAGSGTEALYLLNHGQEAEATALLNWRRDFTPRDQGDDKLGGTLFARVWTPGESKGRDAIELAIASMVTDKSALLTLEPTVERLSKSAEAGFEQDSVELVLAKLYLDTNQADAALTLARGLLARDADSPAAISLAGRGYQLTGNFAVWKALVDGALEKNPNDRKLLLERVREAEAEGDYDRALRGCRSVLDAGRAGTEDQVLCARLSLFAGKPDEQARRSAEQANLSTRNDNATYLMINAWVDAGIGETAEARELLLQSMEMAGLAEPDADAWFGFGRIYEQYGELAEAAAAYRRIEKGKSPDNPLDTYLLARMRLNAMNGN
jgi:tetratricopeptide (TPR) repeat protein